MVPNAVENEVITLATLGEVIPRVVDDPVRADRLHQVNVPRTAYAGHIRAKRLGDLHAESAHASRSAVHQDLLPRMNPALVAEALQRSACRNRNGCRLLETDVWRLEGQSRFEGARILGKGSSE